MLNVLARWHLASKILKISVHRGLPCSSTPVYMSTNQNFYHLGSRDLVLALAVALSLYPPNWEAGICFEPP